MSQPSSNVMTTAIMVAAVIVIFMVFLFALFFYLHVKRYSGANPTLGRARARARARAPVAVADEAAVPRRGLDPAAIKALPYMVFGPEVFKEGLECAVCLSELSKGEEARLLPGCRHGFHLECIDMWLNSHSTCPLCRSPVLSENADSGVELAEDSPVEAVLAAGRLPESPIFPTNVLFWGSQDQVTTGGPTTAAVAAGWCEGSSSSMDSSTGRPDRKLVIDVERRMMEGCQCPALSRLPVDEIKSPTSARLRSLRRLLSQGNRGIGSSCSLRVGDIEQGIVGVGVAVDGSLQMPKISPSS
ncbi:RING-H2 finger protein ATL3 [Elaeis guineensis]|uniref:RING-type E3 ubiquitin transferase n=1 Tax=Elaeis guineensis var. tenera TaxID=51953 RepID=A0A6I9S3T0_ELAGV|nr:RING-H2 finger protein ATL3 [Elaeis guineensis]